MGEQGLSQLRRIAHCGNGRLCSAVRQVCGSVSVCQVGCTGPGWRDAAACPQNQSSQTEATGVVGRLDGSPPPVEKQGGMSAKRCR